MLSGLMKTWIFTIYIMLRRTMKDVNDLIWVINLSLEFFLKIKLLGEVYKSLSFKKRSQVVFVLLYALQSMP